MSKYRWPMTMQEMATLLKIKPRTLGTRIKEIETEFGVICCTPTGRSKLFFEDDFERLRDCLKRLKNSSSAAGFITSAAPLPGDGYTRALKLAAKIRKRGRKSGRRPAR